MWSASKSLNNRSGNVWCWLSEPKTCACARHLLDALCSMRGTQHTTRAEEGVCRRGAMHACSRSQSPAGACHARGVGVWHSLTDFFYCLPPNPTHPPTQCPNPIKFLSASCARGARRKAASPEGSVSVPWPKAFCTSTPIADCGGSTLALCCPRSS